jgi:putative PEP-CTERM system histidine kinase
MQVFGSISYTVLGGLYAVLTLLLLTAWRGRRIGGFLIAACVVSIAWAALLAVDPLVMPNADLVLFSIEVLRSGAWLLFLSVIAAKIGVSRPVLVVANVLWVGLFATGITVWLGRDLFGPIVDLARVLIPGGLAMALAGLMLIEQLYRNAPGDSRWGIKAIVLGLGGLFAYDLFLYSQGVLFGALDATTWQARGVANAMFVPLIAISARRNPDWDLDIFVSRQVVFYSMSLVAVGAYLLLMSLGGYALLLYGGTWGGLLRTVFFVGAALVLVLLLFSSVLRAKLKVFLSKHFYRNRYDYREEWLRLVNTLSEIGEDSVRDVAVKAVAQVVEAPAGQLWVRDEAAKAYSVAGSFGALEMAGPISLDDPLVQFVQERGWLVDLEEYQSSPELYDGFELPLWLADRDDAWLVVPMIAHGILHGLVMLDKAAALRPLNYEDRDLLKTIGNHIAVHLAQERSDSLLAEAQQFEAYNRLTTFLMHDLNNLIAQQSLIVANAEKHKRNPEFVDDAIQTISNSVDRMKNVMRQLRRGRESGEKKSTELRFVVSAAVDECAVREPAPTLELNEVNGSVSVNADEFRTILAHLIRNAQDATPADGEVTVRLVSADGRAEISIEDTGSGMSDEFMRNRLFRPFDSTKGAQGMGIGAYQAREFVRRMGGEFTVESTVTEGTRVRIGLELDG